MPAHAGDTAQQPAVAPVLCLPGPAFWHDHSKGELVVAGVPLIVHQEGGQGRGTAWAVWDGAVVAALWLAAAAADAAAAAEVVDNAETLPWRALRARGALELGAGTGLAGLAAAAALRCAVTLSDLPDALPALRRNVSALPALAPLIHVTPLDWTALHQDTLAAATPHGPPALIIAADCVWLAALVPPFVAALDALVAPDTRVLLVHQSRSAAVDDAMWAALARARLAPRGAPPSPLPQPPGAEAAAPRVYLLRRLPADVVALRTPDATSRNEC